MVASNEMYFGPVANDHWTRFILVHVRIILMNCLCQGHPSVNVIDHGHCNAHVCVRVHICVFSAHAQPFSFSSKYLLHKRQCILHLDKHWIFKVSSIFGCFESLIFTKFLASQDGSLFFEFFAHLRSRRCFSLFFHVSTSKNLPDVPDVCPTFRARRARRLPDVCPTSPDVPDVSLSPKKSKRLAHPLFQNLGTSRKMEVFFIKKNLPKRREN